MRKAAWVTALAIARPQFLSQWTNTSATFLFHKRKEQICRTFVWTQIKSSEQINPLFYPLTISFAFFFCVFHYCNIHPYNSLSIRFCIWKVSESMIDRAFFLLIWIRFVKKKKNKKITTNELRCLTNQLLLIGVSPSMHSLAYTVHGRWRLNWLDPIVINNAFFCSVFSFHIEMQSRFDGNQRKLSSLPVHY